MGKKYEFSATTRCEVCGSLLAKPAGVPVGPAIWFCLTHRAAHDMEHALVIVERWWDAKKCGTFPPISCVREALDKARGEERS